jgi:hypothetical protein
MELFAAWGDGTVGRNERLNGSFQRGTQGQPARLSDSEDQSQAYIDISHSSLGQLMNLLRQEGLINGDNL